MRYSGDYVADSKTLVGHSLGWTSKYSSPGLVFFHCTKERLTTHSQACRVRMRVRGRREEDSGRIVTGEDGSPCLCRQQQYFSFLVFFSFGWSSILQVNTEAARDDVCNHRRWALNFSPALLFPSPRTSASHPQWRTHLGHGWAARHNVVKTFFTDVVWLHSTEPRGISLKAEQLLWMMLWILVWDPKLFKILNQSLRFHQFELIYFEKYF